MFGKDAGTPAAVPVTAAPMLLWLGHAAFKINFRQSVAYIDPFHVKRGAVPADLILITHPHPEHCSLPDIEKIVTPRTVIIAPAAAAGCLGGKTPGPVIIRPGDARETRGVRIEAVAAYHAGRYHAPENGGVGFVVSAGGKRIYHCGDSGFIPEMRAVCCDIALLPVAGAEVMTCEEAASAAEALRPGLAIPMHYGSVCGTIGDGEEFCRRAMDKGVPAKLITPA